MAKGQSSKVFIKKGNQYFLFLFALLMEDETVIIGYPAKVKSGIKFVNDKVHGELRPPDLYAPEEVNTASKISFHPSGQYKLTSKMARTFGEVDRATIVGPRLKEILTPRRMAEFLIPDEIPEIREPRALKDIVLDASHAPNVPLRCTVFCMSHEEFDKIIKDGKILYQFVDTSVWESVHALESEDHVWVFVLRQSREDTTISTGGVFLIGEVKWANPPPAMKCKCLDFFGKIWSLLTKKFNK